MAEQENTPARVGKVVQQATVIFAGAEITAVLAEDGFVYGALPHLCRALGLDADGQRERIDEQPALAKGLLQFPLAQSRQLITTWCLRSDLVPYWLAVVSTRRMKSEKRQRIDFYQDQVGDVLGRLFGAAPGPSTEVRWRLRWPRSSAAGTFLGRSSGSSIGPSMSPPISCSPRRSTPRP
jgi:hypothetical protein